MGNVNNASIPAFQYNTAQLHLHPAAAPDNPSDLDTLLKDKWEEALNTGGIFRYTLPRPQLPFKTLPGKYSFLLQLNPDRGSKRRPAEEVSSLQQPFNPDRFHFNLIPDKEILFHLQPQDWEAEGGGDVLINVSPLEWGHVLLTPSRGLNRPQRITRSGLRLALELALLSSHSGFRLGFNSLCGYASVNHEHYHAYYLGHELYLQNATLVPLDVPPTGDGEMQYYELEDYPAKGLALVLEDVSKLEGVVDRVMTVASHLQATNTAHNLFITRGSGSSDGQNNSSLRIFLWARESSYGAKESDGFNPALCELAGHFPCKNEEAYGRLDETRLVQLLTQLTAKPWTSLRQALLQGSLNN